jgi:hypothetical protein
MRLTRRTVAWTAICSLCVLAGLATRATAYDPIFWYSTDDGGSIGALAGTYRLSGTIGQHDAGTLTGGVYVLRGGFWHAGAPASTGVEAGDTPPLAFSFRAPTPNPVRSRSRLAFDLPMPARASLRVFDVSGRAVQTKALGMLPAGRYERAWAAEDDRGRPLATGVYFMRFEAGEHRSDKKVLVLR